MSSTYFDKKGAVELTRRVNHMKTGLAIPLRKLKTVNCRWKTVPRSGFGFAELWFALELYLPCEAR